MRKLSLTLSLYILTACSQSESDDEILIATKYEEDSEPTAMTTPNELAYDGPYLVFEFPDGVRGGFGKFVGANYGELEGSKDGNCGEIAPVVLNHITHRTFVVTKSSSRDKDVVKCVLRTSTRHFNVYHADDRSKLFPHGNEEPFRNLMNNPDAQRLNRGN